MSITKGKFNGALKSFVTLDAKNRAAMMTAYTYIAFYTLKDGNKAPLDQLKDKNGIPAWVKAGATRAVMGQDVRYRTDQAAGWSLAERHATTVVEALLDKKQDDSDEAKAKREAAKAKREAEALKLKEQARELESVQDEKDKLELELAKAKSKLKEAQPQKRTSRGKRPEAEQPGKVEQQEAWRISHIAATGDAPDEIIQLTEEEYHVALEAIYAFRKAGVKVA